MKRPVYHFKDYLSEHFDGPVRKLPLHAHLGCPHRDPETGAGGCIYCYNPGFSDISKAGGVDIRGQLRTAMEKQRAKGAKTRFIAYFQTETNTHAPLEKLRDLWESVLEYPREIVGLSVSTRPDCLSHEILACLSDMSKRLMVWVETGLQSSNDRTLQRIRRGHDAACFRHSVDLIRQHAAILHCVHIILGLPGESLEDMRSTVAEVNLARPHGIKIHHLQIVRHTDLEEEYRRGLFSVLQARAYRDILIDLLPRLSSDIVIHRLVGEIHGSLLAAPHWEVTKTQFVRDLEARMEELGLRQGSALYSGFGVR